MPRPLRMDNVLIVVEDIDAARAFFEELGMELVGETTVEGPRLLVTVTGYDDSGDGIAVAGATVRAGSERAQTDGDGKATLTLERGRYLVHAVKRGAIRSFAKRVIIE